MCPTVDELHYTNCGLGAKHCFGGDREQVDIILVCSDFIIVCPLQSKCRYFVVICMCTNTNLVKLHL
jgi:hypothetical protein